MKFSHYFRPPLDCPVCGSTDTNIYDGGRGLGSFFGYYRCAECHYRFEGRTGRPLHEVSLRNTLIFACLILLGMLAMGGFNPDFGKDTRPDVVPLTVPAYPNARRSTVAPLSGSPNMLFGSRTTFTTTDSPETLSAWYTTTMHGMGWGDVGNSTSDQTMILFDDYRGCPGASARIDWDAPVSGITTVEIEYYTAACRR